ncbi:MAG TPA: hypothetical protein HPQ04_13940 [Rhodospirillaceae bacterium]|nr:hypothetical protein [Rhodospirillaceae bacterium]
MLHTPHSAMLELASHLTKDVLVIFAAKDHPEVRQPGKTEPICLNDAGWTEHYGHRHYDVDVERI